MSVSKGNLLYSGKAKSLFETSDPALLIAEFRDDTTAFDGEKKAQLADKGFVNNRINAFICEKLEQAGVPTHFHSLLSATESLVKRLTMIPLESVVRNVAAGGLCRRLGVEAKTELNPPLQEFFLKNDELHDPMFNENHALAFGWATQNQLDTMKSLSFKINAVLKELFAKGDLVLVDAKYEFGVDAEGKMHLADEISPDSCRIWDKATGQSLDKDRFRKDLGDVISSYREVAERIGVVLDTENV